MINYTNLIEKISNLLTGSKTLFLIDDIIADEALDKRRQPWLYQAVIGSILYGCQPNHTLPFLIISGDKQRCFTFGVLRT